MSIDTDQHEGIVRDYLAWLNGDSSAVDVLSETIDVYNPGLPAGEVHNRDDYAAYIEESRSGFPDIHFADETVVTSNDTTMVELAITGTHTGEYRGLPPTGRPVKLRGVEVFEIADGHIQELRVYYDTKELAEQLGLTFPEVVGQLPKLAWRKLR